MRYLPTLTAFFSLLLAGCFEPSGGVREALPGLDGGTQLCGASVPCPEGELCHPSGVCIPCPGGSCGGEDSGGASTQDATTSDATPPQSDGALSDAGETDGGVLVDMAGMDMGAEADQCAPVDESCNGLDDDCDLRIDEDFDLATSADHCGACGRRCADDILNAESACDDGVCTLVACAPGFRDEDENPANGCEAAELSLGVTAPEDGAIYRDDFDVVLELSGLDDAGHIEATVNGEFLGRQAPAPMLTFPIRSAQYDDGALEFRAEAVDLNSAVIAEATIRVLLDREAPIVRFLSPAEGLRAGIEPLEVRLSVTDVDPDTTVEIEANGDSVFLSSAPPFAVDIDPEALGAGPLLLVARARDRAGHLTETQRALRLSFCQADEMVAIPDMPVQIDRYEGSRPDATDDEAGTDSRKACSQPGVLPWSSVDYLDAELACEAAGKRLCTPAEWRQACGHIARTRFPYGDLFDRQACNGLDNEDVMGVMPAGFLPECASMTGAFDMSGNLAEWTSEEMDSFGVNGGSYVQSSADMTCQSRLLISRVRRHPSQGFRCCLDTP